MSRLSPETFDELCPSSMLPIRMQNKWAPLIMRLLGEGAQPFRELRRALPRTSPKELTRALRSLDRDGFVTRDADTDFAGYRLTPLGQSLLAVLLNVYAWTAEHWDEIVDARERADHSENDSPVNNVLARNT
ncbi:helix-turn-helix domain-containing protein [Streptomyces canus]|uniref:winged helix-turn-helix transcriptional regulator n=1 Tax=Streptomyces canus TaxID=58343 RepID=UPI002E283817|nr:helix-turn-helix domain-containing protein [Streptomyces canus]